MDIIKKIFWLLVLLFITYIILIFIKPNFADKIAERLGITSFNEKVRIIKGGVDYVSTKIPNKNEIERAYSGAKEKVGIIKEKINNIRDTADDLNKKYEKTKDFINKTGEKIEKVQKSLNDLQKVGEEINSIVNTGAIK